MTFDPHIPPALSRGQQENDVRLARHRVMRAQDATWDDVRDDRTTSDGRTDGFLRDRAGMLPPERK